MSAWLIIWFIWGFEEAYLFGTFYKLILDVDSSPNESQTNKMCIDIIDVVLTMSVIYGDQKENEKTGSYFDDNSNYSIIINNNNSKNIMKGKLY